MHINPRWWRDTMGRGLLPERNHGPQCIGGLNPDRAQGEDAGILLAGSRQCPAAAPGLGRGGGGLVMGSVHWMRSCWQARELRRSWAAAHHWGGWTWDWQALCRGWTAPRSLPNGIIPWFCDIRTNKCKQIFLNMSMKETLSTGSLATGGMSRFIKLRFFDLSNAEAVTSSSWSKVLYLIPRGRCRATRMLRWLKNLTCKEISNRLRLLTERRQTEWETS